jgi:hypothetical protein
MSDHEQSASNVEAESHHQMLLLGGVDILTLLWYVDCITFVASGMFLFHLLAGTQKSRF